MTHWTFEDSLKYLLVGVVSLSFVLVDGRALVERLNFRSASLDVSAELDPQEAAHQHALHLEQEYPMIDVLGYGHGDARGIAMTYVLFGVVDSEAVQSREQELALALMQLAGRLAEESTQALVVVHFSFSKGLLTGELNCPRADYTSYADMQQGGCVAAVYPPDEQMPLQKSMVSWAGVGK